MTTSAKAAPPELLLIRARWRIESAAGTELVVGEHLVETCIQAMIAHQPVTISYPYEFRYPDNFNGVKMKRSLYFIEQVVPPKNGEASVFITPTRGL